MSTEIQRRRGTAAQHTTFTGAAGELTVNTDNNTIHVHDGTTAGGFETARKDQVLLIDSSGNVQLGNNAVASNTLRYFDVYNIDTGATAGAIARFITSDAAGTGITSVDLVKYKNGSFYINNNEPTSAASIVIQNAGAERMRIDSTGIKASVAARGSSQTASITGATTLDFVTYQNFVLTLTGNITLDNPTTEAVGQSGFIVFKQDATGGRTISLGTNYKTAGGAGITLSTSANAIDIVPYVVSAVDEILLGTPQLAFA